MTKHSNSGLITRTAFNGKNTPFSEFQNNLRIGTRLTIGVTIILLLTVIVGLVGWFTLESQSRSQTLANQAIDLVSALRAARQDEKNYMLSGNTIHIDETLEAIKIIQKNAEMLKTALAYGKRNTIEQLLKERDRYQSEFENFVTLNKKKDLSLNKMVSQGRELENTAVTLRDDQKRELQRLEALAISSSDQRQKKREKADDANRIIKLMGEARQQEKNFLLRGDLRYADETKNLVDNLILQAKSTQQRFEDKENKILAQQIIDIANQYLSELEKVKDGKQTNAKALERTIKLGRLVENQTRKLREDQKQQLINLEKKRSEVPLAIRRDKREKADSANRIIKLMGEARQQEKNFLLRKEQSYAEVTKSLVLQMINIAIDLQKRFKDKQNQALVTEIINAAEQYILEFEQIVKIITLNVKYEDSMASLGRRVEELSSQLRGDQKLELQRLENLSTRSSRQRLDKRIKADTTNKIIKLMGEARQQEKNYLLRSEQAYTEITRDLVNQAIRHAELLRERFQDKQNRYLAEKIIIAAKTYLKEFENVIIANNEQIKQQQRMIEAAREIESLAINIRNTTQSQADFTKKTAVIVIFVSLFMALTIGLATAALLTNSISKPIKQLVTVINRLAKEDNVDVPLVTHGDEIGQIARAISNFKEIILERKEKTEAQLIQSEKMAALGDLVAGVAHEINTPIGIAVTGSTHLQDKILLLEKSFDAGSLRKTDFKSFINNALPTAESIQRNLERASSLIKSFKQVAVDQSSQEIRQFYLVEYLEEILVSLQPKLKQSTHRILIEGDHTLQVETVPGAISQIITNLIFNSIVHAYENNQSGNITISVETSNNSVILRYADDGKGMANNVIQHMYEPFFTTRRGKGGSGLGLSIIFNLVSQTLGGTIQCHSEINVGTEYEINFPIKSRLKLVI